MTVRIQVSHSSCERCSYHFVLHMTGPVEECCEMDKTQLVLTGIICYNIPFILNYTLCGGEWVCYHSFSLVTNSFMLIFDMVMCKSNLSTCSMNR